MITSLRVQNSLQPYRFNEHGVTMLASAVKSKKAIQMNIAIVRAFIALKQFALGYKELAEQIKELKETTSNRNVQLNQVYDALMIRWGKCSLSQTPGISTRNCPRSSPQFFWISLRGNDKKAVAAKFMEEIMKAVDLGC